MNFDEAMEALDKTEASDALHDWHYAVSKSEGGNTALPIVWWCGGSRNAAP